MYRKDSRLGQFHLGESETLSRMNLDFLKRKKVATLSQSDKSEFKKIYPKGYGEDLNKKANFCSHLGRESIKKYNVVSYSVDTKGKKIKGEGLEFIDDYTRVEMIDTKNSLFKNAKNEEDVKDIYEAFWNINRNSGYTVHVTKVIPIKESSLKIVFPKVEVDQGEESSLKCFCEHCGSKLVKKYNVIEGSKDSQSKEASAYTDFVKKFMTENKGSSMSDAAKAWKSQKPEKKEDSKKEKIEPKKEEKGEEKKEPKEEKKEPKKEEKKEEPEVSKVEDKELEKIIVNVEKEHKETIDTLKKDPSIPDKQVEVMIGLDHGKEINKENPEEGAKVYYNKETGLPAMEKELEKTSSLTNENFPKIEVNKIPYSRRMASLLFDSVIPGRTYRKKCGSNRGTVWDIHIEKDGKRFLIRKKEIDKEAFEDFS